ncbi:hypothetical protein PRIPAC_92338, partial [Pristionchus pacificus]|uniref:Uncharacterized protein n=1 Tax=Pristionchus pacificus TaxID=54126 RepID=A0A2A6CH01_PRIPA
MEAERRKLAWANKIRKVDDTKWARKMSTWIPYNYASFYARMAFFLLPRPSLSRPSLSHSSDEEMTEEQRRPQSAQA